MRLPAFLLLLLCLPAVASAAPRYRLTDLGPVAYGDAPAINSRSEVALTAPTARGKGFVAATVISPRRVCLWRAGRRTSLGTLPGYGSTIGGVLNDRGEVAGTLDQTTDGAAMLTDEHAFLWSRGRLEDISDYPVTQVRAMNNRGQIVGSGTNSGRPVSDDPQEIKPYAFLYSGGRMTDLGWGVAQAINDRGQVSGVDDQGNAVIWERGKAKVLSGVRAGREIIGRALVNDRGQVAVSNGQAVYLWASGRAVALPLPPGAFDAEVDAISDTGDVVGAAQVGGKTDYHALLWRRGRICDLNASLPSKSGWLLERATGINRRGRIVGLGEWHGQPHGFLLTPR